ncbi:PREDICTED: fasciclin-3 isoform X2 [Acromyrmex echinatior]|uniref:fasciclin-3 isoform X2 n=1 Tax=Acromyrmex echinatior TaxID=103372 RepID=UPI000580C77D|nr:PREDICTED: fasciclin-3 isoform X2 [Acromyrmex echinatior]
MCTRATSGSGSGSGIRMTTFTITVWACVIAVLCSSIVEAKSNMFINIEPKGETAVRVGEPLQILCTAPREIRVCRVEIPGEGSILLIPSDPPSEDGNIEYYGKGLITGECGVRIAKVKESHHGIFKCSLNTRNTRQEATASLNIVVAKPPETVEIFTNSGSLGGNTFRKGEKLEISCKAKSGRPAANLTLFLDEEPIGEERISYDMNMNAIAMQNASRSLDWTDNGRTIRCIANHIALDRPIEQTKPLEVYYPPQSQPTVERFGYVIGRRGIINVTVHAHPRPRFIWRVNDERIEEGRPDESNRLETSTAVDLGNGAWSVILMIDSVQKSDTEKEYMLMATNNEGSNEYRIVLSTSSEPAGPLSNLYGVDLDAGSIIGIVVGVLVLLLIIFLVIFARATGRWCFAGRSTTRNLGESDFADPATGVSLLQLGKSKTTADVVRKRSDTESAGRYSRSEVDGASSQGQRKPRINLSRFFGRNKDKVSGADTDTMKTVVTVDDEKLQTVEPAVQEGRTNPSTGEGGIVYAELDLTQQQQGVTPRRINEDKTEYAEILYTKPETEETADK